MTSMGPGHSHNIPGIWDITNGPPDGGTPCEWCEAWIKFKSSYAIAKETLKPVDPHEPGLMKAVADVCLK